MADNVTQPISQPIVEPAKPSRLKFILIVEALVLVIAAGIVILLFVKRNATNKTSTSISPTSAVQAENKMSVPMETKYENPFSEKTQYQNPFSKNNPFDNLK